ncbi:MAG: glycosyltransferase [Candidatus Binatia bacterium]
MSGFLDNYTNIAGEDVIRHLRQLCVPLRGMKVVHINSTKEGGGVAEILTKLVPFKQELGIDAHWEVIAGDEIFFDCTKRFHNALQGMPLVVTPAQLKKYEEINAANADRLRPILSDADIVFVHDPQPAALIQNFPQRKGKWIWRCHIDVSHPHRNVWHYLRNFVSVYDASIFSLADFAQVLPHPVYLIAPSIDPLSEKNIDLNSQEIDAVCAEYQIDRRRPVMLQVSRFDRFKDPLGVIQAYRMVKEFVPSLQLVLAGGSASDDPEGAAVLAEVRAAADGDNEMHILCLPADSHRTINALQRAADVVLQKSIREGFGLTVTEAMWKSKPVIGGDTGGIRLQIVNHHTGFLVHTPEGAALRTRYLLSNRNRLDEMGRKARQFVCENFLITRHLREYLTLMVGFARGVVDRLELS